MEKELENSGSSEIQDWSAMDGESGFESTGKDTFKTPFLKIIQALSPELKKSGASYIEGVEMGDMLNSATHEIHKEMDVIVLKIVHSLLVWKQDRGGIVGRFSKDQEDEIVSKREGLKKWDADGNDVVDTIEFFCLNANNPSDIFILPMSTASLKHAKSWATRLRMLQINGKSVGVSWAGIWKISTMEEGNDLGDWYTIGSTPKFNRVITKEEKIRNVDPARALLKTADTDYDDLTDSSEKEEESSPGY